MTWVFFSLAVASASIAWILVVVALPRYFRSAFRYRLWRLRDDLVDDVLSGNLPDVSSVREMRKRVEVGIRYADDLTLATVLVSAWATHASGFTVRQERKIREQEARRREELTAKELVLVDQYESRLTKASVVHVLTGSPSGWIGVLLAALLSPLVAVVYFGIKVCRRIASTQTPHIDRGHEPSQCGLGAHGSHLSSSARRMLSSMTSAPHWQGSPTLAPALVDQEWPGGSQ